MAEHRIVVPGVVGSTPITHPTFILNYKGLAMKYFLGLDIGGSSVKYGIGNSSQGLLVQDSFPLQAHSLLSFQSLICSHVEALINQFPQYPIHATGIGTPGTIELGSGLLRGVNPNLSFWIGEDPVCVLPGYLQARACCGNDANLMTLAEAQGLSGVVLGLTVGTGIGTGLVLNGEIFRGAHGFAMELGHITLERNGKACKCGLQGCLESYSSVTGIMNSAKLVNSVYTDISLAELIAESHNQPALAELIDKARSYLVQALQIATLILDPGFIILGGGGMDAGLYNASQVAQELHLSLGQHPHRPELFKAKRGNSAGVIGAILLAEQRFGDKAEQNLHLI